jgi:sulfoxide reductase catalytic subunit YedY
MKKIRSSEITPEHIYLDRRKFMIGVGSAAALALAACAGAQQAAETATESTESATPKASLAGARFQPGPVVDLTSVSTDTPPTAGKASDELGDPLNTFEQIINYNNFYEFSTDKEEVASLSKDFKTRPWTVEVGGLVENPKSYDIDDLLKRFQQTEHIYRLRCVEAWSMVIPWIGFKMADLLQEVQPKPTAKYVKFTSVMRPEEMPGQASISWLEWPYVEGLRLDEAMHPLSIFVTGMYGKLLTPSNGAPIRMMSPWKYGFKNIKAIVKIELVSEQPVSTWSKAAPNEYGFYANVNPAVDHPRWSQASERRIGELKRRPTLMFNGYEAEVASLYKGMDLRVDF